METEDFLTFEQKLKLFDDEIKGIRYWHVIRKDVFDEIQRNKKDIGTAHTTLRNRNKVYKALLKVKQIPNILFNSPVFLTEKDVLVLNHHRRVKQGPLYECIYTDEIVKQLEGTYIVLEDPILNEHYRPIPTESIKYTDYIHSKYVLKRVFNRIFKRSFLSSQDKLKIVDLIELINTEFSIDIDVKYLAQEIENMLFKFEVFYKYFEKLINKINPKLIIEVASYSFSRYVINDIANKKGIPTVELQHGIMGKCHAAYNFPGKMNLPTFPKYILVFGQYWKDNTRFPIEQSKVKVVGWPYYERKITQYTLTNKDNRKQVILFISQGTIGKELSKIALDLFKKLDINRYKIIYKLHPGEYARWQNEYPWLIQKDLEIVDNNEHDMHYYFAQADIQVGVYSTALFEGLGYRLKTFICNLYGYEFMEELYGTGTAKLVASANDIIMNLNIQENTKPQYDISYFWQSNTIDNIVRELNSILRNTNYN